VTIHVRGAHLLAVCFPFALL